MQFKIEYRFGFMYNSMMIRAQHNNIARVVISCFRKIIQMVCFGYIDTIRLCCSCPTDLASVLVQFFQRLLNAIIKNPYIGFPILQYNLGCKILLIDNPFNFFLGELRDKLLIIFCDCRCNINIVAVNKKIFDYLR